MPSDDPRTDGELLSAIAQAEEAACAALYYRHRDWVYRLAYRFTGHAEDAQDATQEVFVYLARAAGRIDLRVRLTSFLYPVVKHIALAIRRKRKRAPELNPELELPAPAAAPEASEERRRLAEVLAGLEEHHREILLMRFVDDLTLEEIARALGIPLGTAKSRLHHAVKHLQTDPRCRRYFENL